MLKNIVVATEKKGYYNILEHSCKRHNIDLIPLGMGEKWTGFTMRFNLWYNYLNTLNNEEIVMINDAYDVVILQDANIILEKFKKYNTKVLFSSGRGMTSNLTFYKFKKYVTCMGNIIGEVKYIKKIIKLLYKYKSEWKRFNYDDQLILGYVILKECAFFKKYVDLDTKSDFFFVSEFENFFYIQYLLNNNIKGLQMKNNKIYNTNNKLPVVLHLACLMNGNKYLEYLNYDISTVNLEINKYKIKQAFVLIKHILKNLSIYIYIYSYNNFIFL